MKYAILIAALISTSAFAEEPKYVPYCKAAYDAKADIPDRVDNGALCKEYKEMHRCATTTPAIEAIGCLRAKNTKAEQGRFKTEWLQELTILKAAGM